MNRVAPVEDTLHSPGLDSRVLVAPPCHESEADLRLGLPDRDAPEALPFLVGWTRRWYANAGINLLMHASQSEWDPLDALCAGRVDVAITTPVRLLMAAGKGQPVVGFSRFQHGSGGVVFLRGHGVDRPRALVGKRLLAPPALGAVGGAVVRAMVEADGGHCGPDDLTVVNGHAPTQPLDLLMSAQADVLAPAQYARHVVSLRYQHQDAGFFSFKEWRIPELEQLVFATSRAFLHQQGPLLSRLVGVARRAVDFVYQHPEGARSLWVQRWQNPRNLDRAVCAATLPCFSNDFSLSREYLCKLEDWMLRCGLLDKRVDSSLYWTNELAL